MKFYSLVLWILHGNSSISLRVHFRTLMPEKCSGFSYSCQWEVTYPLQRPLQQRTCICMGQCVCSNKWVSDAQIHKTDRILSDTDTHWQTEGRWREAKKTCWQKLELKSRFMDVILCKDKVQNIQRDTLTHTLTHTGVCWVTVTQQVEAEADRHTLLHRNHLGEKVTSPT